MGNVLAALAAVTDFYMDPVSTHHDFNKGLACLRQYLDQYESISPDLDRIEEADDIHVQNTLAFGLMLEDAQAALCLADHVSKHPQDARRSEAYILYSAVAANSGDVLACVAVHAYYVTRLPDACVCPV